MYIAITLVVVHFGISDYLHAHQSKTFKLHYTTEAQIMHMYLLVVILHGSIEDR